MSSDNDLIIREKTTSPITFNLYANNSVIDLSSVDHVEMQMVDAAGKVYRYSSNDGSPALFITTPTSGLISFYPPDDDVFSYDRTPYKMYCWVYSTVTQKYSVPSTGYSKIDVLREY